MTVLTIFLGMAESAKPQSDKDNFTLHHQVDSKSGLHSLFLITHQTNRPTDNGRFPVSPEKTQRQLLESTHKESHGIAAPKFSEVAVNDGPVSILPT